MFTRYNFSIAGLLPKDDECLIPGAGGLFVSPERTIETDGHQCVIVTAPESQPGLFSSPDGMTDAEFFVPFIMDRESSLNIAKMIPRRDPDAPENSMVLLDVLTESESDSTVAITENIRRAIFKSVKQDASKFPAIDRILPSADESRFEFRLNPDLLCAVLGQFKKFCSEESAFVTVRIYGPTQGVRIDAESCGQTMTAIIMPLRMVENEGPKSAA
jgi:hypothetical protein